MHYFLEKYRRLFICITFENSQFTLYFFPSNLDLDFLGLLVSVSGIKFNACLFRSMVDFVSSCHVLLLIVKTYFDERNFWVVIFRNDNVETARYFIFMKIVTLFVTTFWMQFDLFQITWFDWWILKDVVCN